MLVSTIQTRSKYLRGLLVQYDWYDTTAKYVERRDFWRCDGFVVTARHAFVFEVRRVFSELLSSSTPLTRDSTMVGI